MRLDNREEEHARARAVSLEPVIVWSTPYYSVLVKRSGTRSGLEEDTVATNGAACVIFRRYASIGGEGTNGRSDACGKYQPERATCSTSERIGMGHGHGGAVT